MSHGFSCFLELKVSFISNFYQFYVLIFVIGVEECSALRDFSVSFSLLFFVKIPEGRSEPKI